MLATDGPAIHCPLCEYDLRGLIEPRCPECGYQFVWKELLDPSRRVHPYLFEQHPNRNLWSFFRTLIGGLQPWRFWKLLQPQQPSRPRRMLYYWILCAMFPIVIGGGLQIAGTVAENSYPGSVSQRPIRFFSTHWPRAITQSQFARNVRFRVAGLGPAPVPDAIASLINLSDSAPSILFLGGFLICWTFLTNASLLIFGTSMLRAGVKTIHVERCVTYSFDMGFWLGLACLILLPLQFAELIPPTELILLTVMPVMILCSAIRLWAAYRNYLHFHTPFWVVLSTQVIAGLAMFTVMLELSLEHVI